LKFLLVFLLPVFLLQNSIHINNQYEINDIKISYGSYLNDAYLIIANVNTDEVYNEIIIDESGIESFVYLAEVKNNEFIMILEKFCDQTKEYEYNLLLYNIYGELLKREVLIGEPLNFYNHHHVLVIEDMGGFIFVSNDLALSNELLNESEISGIYKLQYQGEAYINGKFVDSIYIDYPGVYDIKIIDSQYEYNGTIIINPEIELIGKSYKDGFIGVVKISSKGDMFLNGDEYISRDIIGTPGIYTMDIYGTNNYQHTFNFKIYPNLLVFDGDDQFEIENGMVFDFPISIYSNVDLIKVNGLDYEGEILTEPGDHLIELVVDNHVIDTVNISLISNLVGVIHNETYDQVRIYAFGDVYLNENKIEGYYHIKEEGVYKILVKNKDESYKEIKFYIEGQSKEEKPRLLPYGILVVSIFGLAIILFKK